MPFPDYEVSNVLRFYYQNVKAPSKHNLYPK